MFPFHRHTLRFRLFLTFSLLTLLIVLTFSALHVYHEIRSFRQRSSEKASLLADSLAGMIRIPLFTDNRKELLRRAAETAGYAGVSRVTLFNAAGQVVAQAGRSPRLRAGEAITGEVTVLPGGDGSVSRDLLGDISRDREPLGMVRVVMDSTELTLFIRSLLVTASLTALFSWAIVSYLSYRVVGWVTRSLMPLIEGLEVMRAGEYAVRIAPTGSDELAEAATAVNELAEALQRRETENERLKLELVLSMRQEVQEERRKMMARLIQTNRMTSLGLMVAGMAHEINTPNAAIRLAAQQASRIWRDVIPILDRMAEEEGSFVVGGMEYRQAREGLAKGAEVALRSAEKIERVVRDLRSYTLGERRDLSEQVDVTRVVTEALSIVRAQGSLGQVRLNPELTPDLPPVRGNRYQLEQVATNLLLNAMQAIPEGRPGTVTIRTGEDPECGEIVMAVSDDGEGISPDLLPHLLEPFFSTRIEKGGSGLGLYITDYIVTEHGGRLSITSEPGRGTQVTVSLPLLEP